MPSPCWRCGRCGGGAGGRGGGGAPPAGGGAVAVPGFGRDLLAVAALLLLAVTRVGNVVVAAAWPLAILAFALHDRPPGVGLGAAIRGLARRVWREHALLVVLGAAGMLALLIGGTHWLIGGYPVRTP